MIVSWAEMNERGSSMRKMRAAEKRKKARTPIVRTEP